VFMPASTKFILGKLEFACVEPKPKYSSPNRLSFTRRFLVCVFAQGTERSGKKLLLAFLSEDFGLWDRDLLPRDSSR